MVFFFKQKTAYEMRISDWSSDVCSSDLSAGGRDPPRDRIGLASRRRLARRRIEREELDPAPKASERQPLASFGIDDEVRIDRVEIVLGRGHDDEPMILPAVIRGFRIERGAGRKADGRAVGAEGRDRIIETIFAANLG